MPNSDEFKFSPEHERLGEILAKIIAYQHSLPDGRAVELDELCRERILSSEDVAFLTSHSVTYKPHRLSDFHSNDMLHMPTSEGCVFIGPSGPPLTKRSVLLGSFGSVVEDFLNLPRPKDELLLHIEFTDEDGMAISPKFVIFIFRNVHWRERLSSIRGVAAELGWRTWQDEEVQGNHMISFDVGSNVSEVAADVVALLKRGCGFEDDNQIVYSAGALE